MKIEHIALWVEDLETMKSFYQKYFGAVSNEKYINSVKQFQSYFLSFPGGDCRIELMQRPDIMMSRSDYEKQTMGIIHFAISLGSREKVDELTQQLEADGYVIAGFPRLTGDGYYESVVLDPEKNIIEITE
ncbi:VOC family protein [Elizabethkingia anophelis]|uniref:Glyoxalase n=2 Tax=Elizabethkingia anophelis TaxID=1117645 RepID=A0A1T3DP16_9FLAO|nr:MULTISPECIES: VOC family protein [Elizabethkingia]AIL46082.1 putative glyoxylase family protein (Lactoylglutathione lyase) [Elizabethkingia anophelis NUHP1]AKH94627.1 glyoxalase [Elizabethkingia anophelis FMS-007]AQW99488.1 glyoxalase [Elizabethkingia anophelis]AQX51813.1 glyoxalase [Elizabethkingia anophelis]AQX90036.1 glyoxalase [Elizabethkingia anophelis]